MSDKVRHWTSFSCGEVNHPNRHAEVDGIEFFAFPYQPYLSATINTRYARVGTGHVKYGPENSVGRREFVGMAVGATVLEPCDPLGSSRPVAGDTFVRPTTAEALDAAFEWAANQLRTMQPPDKGRKAKQP